MREDLDQFMIKPEYVPNSVITAMTSLREEVVSPNINIVLSA